jgi:hypothetical protein
MMARQNDKLNKWQLDKRANCKMTIQKMTTLQNDNLTKQQIVKMPTVRKMAI